MTALRGATVLVTGGAGTIGSTLVDQLLDAGASRIDVIDDLSRGSRANLAGALATGRVGLFEGDIAHRDLVFDLTRGKDLVFHQAAIRITRCAEDPRAAFRVLAHGSFTVIEAAAEYGVQKLVAASSASIYGEAEVFPTPESHHPYNNDTLYGASKSYLEGMLASYAAMTGLRSTALRYFNVYGPRMDVHGVYTEVLVRWMERIDAGLPPLINGTGSQTMDFVHTSDVARANLLAALAEGVPSARPAAVYNVGTGVETSLVHLAEHLLRAMGSDLPVEFGPERAVNGVRRRQADTAAAKRDLGFSARMGLDDGLESLVAWWRHERAIVS